MLKTKNLVTGVVAMAMALVVSVPVFSATNQTISLPKNKVWVDAGDAIRSGNYSAVRARCHSVYPDSGTDDFTKIRCRVQNSSDTVISDTVILSETASDYTSIEIREGYISASPVTFQFRGNTNAAANAVVSYRGY